MKIDNMKNNENYLKSDVFEMKFDVQSYVYSVVSQAYFDEKEKNNEIDDLLSEIMNSFKYCKKLVKSMINYKINKILTKLTCIVSINIIYSVLNQKYVTIITLFWKGSAGNA